MSLPNFGGSTYEPPGIYVYETSTPSTASGSFAGPLAAIVGPALGYRTFTDSVLLNGTNPGVCEATQLPRLSQLGIDTSTIVVTSPGGTPITYTLTTDYTVASIASTDGNACLLYTSRCV